MKLNQVIAQSIVKRAMKIIHYSVNVMDENGIIIASGDPTRIGQRHTGAILALRQERIVEIDAILARQWQYEVKPGINLPIIYQRDKLGCVGISGEPEEVKPYAELVKMTAELIVEQAVALEKERWDHRYREEFILQLLKSSISSQVLEEQATFFNFNFSLACSVILVKLFNPNVERLQELVYELEQEFLKENVVVISFDCVVVLYTSKQNKKFKFSSKRFLTKDYKVAIGANLAGYDALYLSYQTALNALDYGLKHFPKKNIYAFEEYKLPSLLNPLSDSWYFKELMKPLSVLQQEDDKSVLRKTLQQYFLSNCDLSHTSTKLFIHPNTLRYRLDKIEKITGLSFNKLDEKFILYLSTFL
ncbi:sugar diacid recognition domain-containing protein [Otariodibacter sp.]|uniref:sugar diacid recognition domain-containing protein n=1 Tax=Otariodibacter sp. TaxID=3030919 RepID=UPI0026240B85|nr:sugar diacid recognition domain-containing protein [Otariodibacter sp.]